MRAQLGRILDSAAFRTSRRSSDFLRYVVEQTVEGRADGLKERSIGIAVFERSPEYDTNQDPVVRNTAGQVRRRLAQYYLEPGHEAEIRVELPAGSYVPEIYKPVAAEMAAPVAVPGPKVEETAGTGLGRRAWIAGIALAVAAGGGFWFLHSRPSEIEQFWAPMLNHAGPVVLCVGQGHTYKLNPEWDRKFERGLEAGAQVPARDVAPVWDRHVSLSDAQALLRLTALFARFDKPVTLRGGRTTGLDDLRRQSVVLIGAFNNEWTLSLTGELRFYFEGEPSKGLELVRDRQRPDFREWAIRTDVAAAQVTTDYALVTRVQNPTTEQAVVVAAGIRGGGTAAAGEFLTNPAYFGPALKAAPRDWRKRNVQFVLAVKMFGGSPGPPAVVASHFW